MALQLTSSNRQFWFAAFLVLLLDQWTKLLVLHSLQLDDEYFITSMLSLNRIYNPSTIFLNYHSPFGLNLNEFRLFWLFNGASLGFAMIFVLKQKVMQEHSWRIELVKTGLFLMMGSMWGNGFDRVFRPEGVIDFLFVKFEDAAPIMNLADILLFFGEAALWTGWIIIIGAALLNKTRSFVSNYI